MLDEFGAFFGAQKQLPSGSQVAFLIVPSASRVEVLVRREAHASFDAVRQTPLRRSALRRPRWLPPSAADTAAGWLTPHGAHRPLQTRSLSRSASAARSSRSGSVAKPSYPRSKPRSLPGCAAWLNSTATSGASGSRGAAAPMSDAGQGSNSKRTHCMRFGSRWRRRQGVSSVSPGRPGACAICVPLSSAERACNAAHRCGQRSEDCLAGSQVGGRLRDDVNGMQNSSRRPVRGCLFRIPSGPGPAARRLRPAALLRHQQPLAPTRRHFEASPVLFQDDDVLRDVEGRTLDAAGHSALISPRLMDAR